MTVSEILKRENNNLDLVRIIVSVMVLWSHLYSINWGDGSQEPLFKFLKITASGGLGVHIFFFISGLLVTNSLIKKRSISKYVISRFFRLFPALLFLLFITVFIIGPIVTSLSVKEYFVNNQTFRYLFDNLILKINYQLPGCFQYNIWPFDVNGSLWTLPLEVGCYIFLLAIFLLISGKRKLANVFIFVIILIAIIPNQILLMIFERAYITSLTPIVCFAFGSFFAINQDRIKVDFKLILGLFLLLLIFWRYKTIITVLFPFAISVFLLFFSTDKFVLKLKPKYDISYGIYIWHFLILQLLVFYFGSMNIYILFVSSLFLTVLISLFSFVFIERKAINYGYQLGKRMSNSSFNYERIGIMFLILFVIVIMAKLH